MSTPRLPDVLGSPLLACLRGSPESLPNTALKLKCPSPYNPCIVFSSGNDTPPQSVVVSLNKKDPQYKPQITIVLIMGTRKKVTPTFGKPYTLNPIHPNRTSISSKDHAQTRYEPPTKAAQYRPHGLGPQCCLVARHPPRLLVLGVWLGVGGLVFRDLSVYGLGLSFLDSGLEITGIG